MKENIILLLMLLSAVSVFGQVVVSKTDVNSLEIEYVEVWGKWDEKAQLYTAMLDYGQFDDRKTDKAGAGLRVCDKAGQVMAFNSMVHVLNYMHRNGWEVMDSRDIGGEVAYMLRRRTDAIFMSNSNE